MLRKKQKDKKLVIVIGSIVGIIILILLAIIFGKLMGTIFIYEATDGRKGVFSLEPPTPYSLTLAYYESSGINDEARLKFQLIGKKRTVYSSLYELQVFHPDNRICKANNQVMSSFVKCCQVYGWDGTCATNQGSVCCGTKEFFTDNLKITIHNKEIFNQQNMEKDIYYETENFGVYINEICYGKGELKNIGDEIDPIWVEISECEVPINFYSTKEGGISYEFLFAEGINVTYPDTDGDGIRDNIDKCLNEKETFNNYQDEDGCPDENPNELCEFKAGEVLVFEAFNEKDIIYIETMYAEPTRWCHLFKPVILDEYKQIVYTDEILFDALKRGESYIVPQDLTIGIFYFAVKPYDMEIVCKLGQTYVVKDQICIDASAIVTPCYNGILDEQGTCITSPKQNIVCEGQVEVLSDGTQICNVYIPIRETYLCDGVEVENPIDCIKYLTAEYYCDGVQIASPSDCTTNLQKKYYCDGVEISNPNDCINYVPVTQKYLCNGIEVSNPEDCTESVQIIYLCDGEEVDSPEDCIQKLDLQVSYTCAGVPISSPEDCKTSIEMRYYCEGEQITDPNDCKQDIILKYYCGGEEVDSQDECQTNLQMVFLCKGEEVERPEDCFENAELKLKCGDKYVSSLDECYREVTLSTVFECSDPNAEAVERDGKMVCVIKPSVLKQKWFWWVIGTVLIIFVITILVLVYIIKSKKIKKKR